LFFLFQTKQKIDKIKELKIDYDSYLGGLCDFTGELVRLGTNMAAKGKIKEFENASQTIEDIMAELINFDLTSYLRTKYDQARNNLRKIEQISYDINIRK
jgi:predicted translin family RNA/ssDNA-binding protein